MLSPAWAIFGPAGTRTKYSGSCRVVLCLPIECIKVELYAEVVVTPALYMRLSVANDDVECGRRASCKGTQLVHQLATVVTEKNKRCNLCSAGRAIVDDTPIHIRLIQHLE